jgi:hypothetical protein
MTRQVRIGALIVGLALIIGLGGQARAESARPGYSAAGLYNLANSYARAGKPGMAVLYYERASLLAPNDPDIEANLRYVRESSRLPSESRRWFVRALSVASPTTFSWIGVAGLSIAALSLLAGRRTSRHRSMRRAASVVGFMLLALSVGNGVLLWPKLHEAVVITGATPVRVSPVPMGDPLVLLPEATTVRMRAEHEGFVLIETPAGLAGWVSRANLAPVVPRD